MAQVQKKAATQYGTINIFQVILKEIDRFYDFDYAWDVNRVIRRFAVIDGRPKIVYGKWWGEEKWSDERQFWEVTWKWRYFDEDGKDVVPEDPTFLQRQVAREGWYPKTGGRTFWREDSKPPKNCWVYVFQSKSGCREPKLYDELFFDYQGLARRVGYEEWKRAKEVWERGSRSTAGGARPDETKRQISGDPKEFRRLELTKELFDKEWYPACYHFYLAPQQLPWGAIEEIMQDLPNRAVSFNDDFYTDIFLSYDPKTTAPKVPQPGVSSNLPKLAQAIDAGASLGRGVFVNHVMHLPNPVKEAERRAQDLADALQGRERILKEKERADQDKCLLARQIELVTQHDPQMRQRVRPKLDNYLEVNRVDRLLTIAEICARELVCWITRPERCSAPFWTKLIYSPPEVMTALGQKAVVKLAPRPPPDGIDRGEWPDSPLANPYTEAIRCYAHAPVETSEAVLQTIGAVMADLPKTAVGQSWLCDNLKSVLSLTEEELRRLVKEGGKKNPVYGGLELFYFLNDTPGKVSKDLAAGFHAIYAAAWERHHPNFVKFVEEYNQAQEATGKARLTVHPRAVNQVKALIGTFGALQKALDLSADIAKLREKVKAGEDQLEDWCRLSYDIAKTLDSAESIIATWMMVATGKRVRILNLSLPGAFGQAVSLFQGFVDYANSYEPAERTGGLIKIGGMVLELLATILVGRFGGNPWIAAIGLLAWAVQFAGETYRKELNQLVLFLKECEFGPRPRLGWPLVDQRRALEPILHNFIWELEWDDWRKVSDRARRGDEEAKDRMQRGFRPAVYLVIKPQYPHACLSTYWTWKVQVLVEIPGMGMKLKVSFTASRRGLEQRDTSTFPVKLRLKKDGLHYHVCEIDPASYPGTAAFESVTATGTVLLSVEGSLCQQETGSREPETKRVMVGLTVH